ncbi:MAG: YciK family oxidoreductase [Moraxella sp.]|nr:YciK family oxidoreductase [Moraxella sp.]
MLTHDDIRNFTPTPDCLKDKIILVTGAGEGIGRAVALAYAKHGATVLLLGRTQEKLESLYDEIEALGLATPAILPMDLAKASFAQMTQTAHLIQKEFGRLDGILHNAAILGALTPMEMYDPITFDEVMQVNLTAPFRLTQACFNLLMVSTAGSVVFMSSGVAKPRAFWGAYALSKQGVEGLCELFTQETQKHTTLRFNCINPGGTRTNMRAHAFPGEDPMTLPTPEEMLPAYLCLMADVSVGVKGQVVALQPK